MIVVRVIMLITLGLLATITDMYGRYISNRLTGAGVVIGLVASIIADGKGGLIKSIAGIIIPVMLLGILFFLHLLGAGDIKLLCAVGSIAGIYAVFKIFVAALFAGSVIGIFKYINPRNRENRHVIGFALPIFIGIILYCGGLI